MGPAMVIGVFEDRGEAAFVFATGSGFEVRVGQDEYVCWFGLRCQISTSLGLV